VVNLATVSATDWAALTPVATVSSVVINSPPVVSFSVVDGYSRPVVGLTTSQLRFSIAKLVPGADGSQSKWVSYIVGDPATGAPSRPSTENVAANLVDNKDGTYQYTFARDITGPLQTKMAAWFADTANAASPYKKSDVMGADGTLLNYVPTLQHRLAIQLSGSANGGTLENPVNVIYDFIPATGAKVAAADVQREVVSIDSCNTCHEKLAFHGGGRVDTRFCVVCHTDQRKSGFANIASTNLAFPALVEKAVVNATTGITSYLYSKNTTTTSSSYHPTGTDPTYVADGEVSGNFTTMVHKIHNGSALVKQNYNYANVAFNNKGYSMLDNGQKMCSTCHDSTKAKQADNWNTQPSRVACGSCHDGINFADGTGTTLAGSALGHANINLKQPSDVACTICHTSDSTKEFHRTQNVTKHNPTIAAGLTSFTYEIKSAAVDATTKNVTIEFKISAATADANGVLGTSAPVTLLPAAAGMKNPLAGFTGAPSFMLPYALSQDGIAQPVDYNNFGVKQAQANTVSIADLLNSTTNSTLGSIAPSATAGYYTVTILGTNAKSFPSGATMRAVALQGYFTQVIPAIGSTPAVTVARHAISVVKAVTGDTARRKVVEPAKCSNCHEWFEGHGGNRVYETQVCVMCHTPGLATSARGIPDATLVAYPFTAADLKKLTEWNFDKTLTNAALNFPVTTNNFKDMIHGIHAGRDRVTPFVDARDRTPSAITLLDFKRMDFPGKLNNCQTCHVSTTAAVTTFNTVPADTLASTYESINATYKATPTTVNAKASLTPPVGFAANPEDKVTTPYAAACVSCHNSLPGQAHMRLNGGQIQVERLSLAPANESCAVCHGPGKEQDAAIVHK
jgi:OmcA/MtrC family decaheme c-type cytochrome